ncbi:MAG: YlbF family regulator [Vagococcus sp.]
MADREFEYEPTVKQALDQLLEALSLNNIVQEYQDIEEKVGKHEGLKQLVDEIKTHQKEAVEYAHYDKPIAEQEAIHLANTKQETFDTHPLVIEYREKLVEANDLLQHMTKLLERDVNNRLEDMVKNRLDKE